VLVFLKTPGDWVNAGEAVAQVIDPMTDERHTIRASQAGRCFARTARRFASRGMRIAKIAGVTAWRSGSLLSP
jgi:predicted deacylase